MATNNLLVNNEQKVLYDVQKRVERSGHNLSQSRKFPARVGYLYPIFCRKTLPSDSFKISTNILIKQLQPLLVPQMVSFTVNTAFYWVDYSLAFPEFEYFLINQRGSQDIELPYVKLQSKVNGASNYLIPELPNGSPDDNQSYHTLSSDVRTFFGITRNATNEKCDALPFWTYATIKRDFYTNIDRLSDSEYADWFPTDPNKWKLRPGANYAIGDYTVDSSFNVNGHYQNLDSLHVHNVRGDYFVNSYPTPLRGDIPTLTTDGSTTTTDIPVMLSNTGLAELLDQYPVLNTDIVVQNPTSSTGVFTGSKATNDSAYLLSSADGSSGESLKTPKSNSSIASGSAFNNISTQLTLLSSYFKGITSDYSMLTLGNSLQFNLELTTRQLRLLESLTRKREIDILMKPRLKNYLQTYFGVNRYKDDSLYQPVFIGSTTQQILINDIDQTTATSDSPLGRQGATAMSLGSGYVGEYYCRNYGCLMGIMYILPDFDYEPAMPREWIERTPDDFVNPEFAHLSMQPILNKELFVSNDDNWNNEVLGYMGMYDNYRTSQNLVVGDFLREDWSDVRQFAQVRRFSNDNKPEITTSFLDSNSAFDSSVFSVPSLPPFIAQCVTRVEAVRPIPELAIPRNI